MDVENTLIIDDIVSTAEVISRKIRQDYKGKISVNFFTDEMKIKNQVNKYGSFGAIIFVNICFKYHPDVKRTEFAGIKRIIKEALRINWMRREPVIAYGTLLEDIILNSPMGQIFKSNRHHLYFDLTKINEIDFGALINAVSPIPDENKLREIIVKYCAPELKDFLRRTNHYLEKMYKLDRNFESVK